MGAMESDKTTQITDEVIRLMNLQVEVLKGTLAEMSVSQVHEYAERRPHRPTLFGTRLVRNPEWYRMKAVLCGEPARSTHCVGSKNIHACLSVLSRSSAAR